MRNLLLSTVTLLMVPAVSFALPDFPKHTHTNTPIELKPVSHSLGTKLAAVCFLGGGDCSSGGFDKGDTQYDIDTEQQCRNEGYISLNCNSVQEIEDVCPYNAAYGKNCKCRKELVECPAPLTGTGESCDGKYTACTCPAGVLSGAYGCAEYYAAPCDRICKKAKTDNCDNRTAVSTPYGCAEYWSDCSSKCKTAYNDNCRNRTEVEAPYGCAEYWGDCQAKCRVAEKEPEACQIGWIYYADGTCAAPEQHTESKTALGVVVYVNPNGVGGQVMSAWPIDDNGNKRSIGIRWTDYNGNYYDIASLPNYTSIETAMTDYNSCSNTDKIVAAGSASTYPAAWAARKFAPTAATKGKWCLPAAGIMTSIFNNQSAIQTAIAKLGGVAFQSCCNWSSTEYGEDAVWDSYFSYNSYGLELSAKKFVNIVRPVLEF